jgi:hypothetical protein
VVRSNWNTDGTLPLCSVTALHLPGRCHCVCCGSRRWWGPCESCSHGRGMAPHSPRPCTVCPSFPGTLVGSRFFASVPVLDPPLIFFTHRHRRSHASLPSVPCPVLSPFAPLKLTSGAHHGDVVPHLVSHWRPPSTPPPFSVRCATTSVHQAINVTLLASPPSHLHI